MSDYIITYSVDYSKMTVTKEELEKAMVEQENRERCQALKKAYGLEHLEFFRGSYGKFCCRYKSDPITAIDQIGFLDLDFLLKALGTQQAKVEFEDTGDVCVGIDELKTKYLVFTLAGL